MSDFSGWIPTEQTVINIETAVILRDTGAVPVRIVESNSFISDLTVIKQFVLSDTASSLIVPKMDYDFILVKANQAVNITLTDVYAATDTRFMQVHHADGVVNDTNDLTIARASSVEGDVEVTIIQIKIGS